MLAVIRTMQLLNALSSDPEGLGVLDLSNSLDIHKADVSRILSTLEQTGYVIRDEETGKYTVSFKFVAMALKFRDGTRLEDMVRPVLVNLVREIGESVQFAVEQNKELIYVEKEEGIKPLRVASMLGKTAPLHATAAGKVWLASLPTEDVVTLMQQRGMKAVTEHTITNLDELLRELERVRERGYAVSREEVNPTVFGLGVAVRDRNLKVRGALIATLPIFEAAPERVETVRRGVEKSALVLSERLQVIW